MYFRVISKCLSEKLSMQHKSGLTEMKFNKNIRRFKMRVAQIENESGITIASERIAEPQAQRF
jgi:hypothetical protein